MTGPPPGSRVHTSPGTGVKVAVTFARDVPIVTLHTRPDVVQAPDKPPKLDGVLAATSSTWPAAAGTVHELKQLASVLPSASLTRTSPLPSPANTTRSSGECDARSSAAAIRASPGSSSD